MGNRAEDVALSLESIKRCLINMLTALDRDTPQPMDRLRPYFPPHLEPNTFQEPPWLWFTLPELGFPLLMDEFLRQIHPEIEEYMRRHISQTTKIGNRYMTRTAGESTTWNLRHKSGKR